MLFSRRPFSLSASVASVAAVALLVSAAACGPLVDERNPNRTVDSNPDPDPKPIDPEPGDDNVARATCVDVESLGFDIEGSEVPDLTPTMLVGGRPASLFGAVVVQQPAPGTPIEQVGPLAIVLQATLPSGEEATCTTTLNIVDRTPPAVGVFGVDDGGRYFVDDFVPPEIVAIDDVDGTPRLEVMMDGAPWDAAAPLNVGFHTLEVTATDLAGNDEIRVIVFEVSPLPLLPVVGALGSFGCTELEPGVVTFGADVYLGSERFDAKTIDMYTLHLWPLDDDGQPLPLNDQLIRVAGSVEPETGGYAFETTEAFYEAGIWTIAFTGALTTCPSAFLLTGGANRGLGADNGELDFELFLDGNVDDDPFAGLVFAINNDGAMTPRPASPSPGCYWRNTIVSRDFDPDVYRTTRGFQYSMSFDLSVREGLLRGYSSALDGLLNVETLTDADEVNGRATYRMWLEGPENCGCEARVTCTFLPEVRSRVEINSPALATALAVLDVRSEDCGGLVKTASGAVKIGNNDPESITVTLGANVGGEDGSGASISIPIEFKIARGDVEPDIYDVGAAEPRTVNKRDVTVQFYTKGEQKVSADSAIHDPIAQGFSRLHGAERGITLRGVCGGEESTVRW